MSNWQPIETAPKDGTDIIVYRPKFDGGYIPRVGTDYWMTKRVIDPTWARSRKDCPPTHWMHFPAPPTMWPNSGRRWNRRVVPTPSLTSNLSPPQRE